MNKYTEIKTYSMSTPTYSLCVGVGHRRHNDFPRAAPALVNKSISTKRFPFLSSPAFFSLFLWHSSSFFSSPSLPPFLLPSHRIHLFPARPLEQLHATRPSPTPLVYHLPAIQVTSQLRRRPELPQPP